MKNIKFLFMASLFSCVTHSHALSLSIPKSLIDVAVSKKFPKEKLSVVLDQPSTKFSKERQKIELCGTWDLKVPKRNGVFCVDTQLVWNKTKGDIEITKLNIVKLALADGQELPSAAAFTLNASLLTLLDGTSVYTVPEMIGKRLNSIEVLDNSFRLTF